MKTDHEIIMSVFDDGGSEPDFLLKIVLVGDSGVGKSNLLLRWTRDEFNPESTPTIGVEFATRTLEIKGKVVKVHVWDTAGQEQFRALTSAYYRGAVGALIVYDITSTASFQAVSHWLKEVKDNTSNDISCLLIGNKRDLKDSRCVTQDEGIEYGKENKLTFMETSAKDGFRTDEAFETLIKAIVKKLSGKQVDKAASEIMNQRGITISESTETLENNKSCC